MEIKDILKLIDAGFTKEDILKLTVPQAQGAQQTAEGPKPDAEATPEQKPAQEPEKAPQEDAFKKLSDEIAAVKQQVFKFNMQNEAAPTPNDQQQSAVDILASLVNPNYGGK